MVKLISKSRTPSWPAEHHNNTFFHASQIFHLLLNPHRERSQSLASSSVPTEQVCSSLPLETGLPSGSTYTGRAKENWAGPGREAQKFGADVKPESVEVSSIFTLSRDLWSEVDGWSGAGIRNWQISTLGQDEELSDCIFLARDYVNSLLSPNFIIPSSIQNKTAQKNPKTTK